MTTVAIIPISTQSGGHTYQAVAGRRMAAGDTAGQALDALTTQFPDIESESVLIVQRFRPDRYFSGPQQQRMTDLMTRWRAARDSGDPWTAEEQSELESLVNSELQASGQRAEDVAKGLAK